ncbi:MAG: hypothetical protein ACRDJ9_23970, partial [Dehalococcoidia bacterium]
SQPDVPTDFPTTEDELRRWDAFLDLPVWERFPEATAANAQEVYPGVGDPMSFDVNLIAIEHGTRTAVEQMGLAKPMHLAERQEPGFFPVYYGYVHINISAFREWVKYIPSGSPDALDEQLFGKTRNGEEPAWKPGLREQAIRARTLLRLIPLVRRTPHDLARNEQAVEGFMQEMQAAEMAAWSDAELMATLDRSLKRNLRTTEIHSRVTLFSGNSLENLRGFLVERDCEDVDALVADLCTGLREIESAKPGREISRLAAAVRADKTLRRIFQHDPASILAAIESSDERSVQVFGQRFQGFLRRYGYRGVRELGIATHVWAQRPESVIALIKSYAERPHTVSADVELADQERRREQTTADLERRLSRMQRRRFRGLLRAAHESIAARELAKAQWARSTHSIRLLVREAGRRLVERGAVDEVDDIPYMRLRDLRSAMAGEPRSDLRELIAGYKKTKEVCERVVLPERFMGKPEARWRADVTETPRLTTDGVLRGIPVSPGRVTAKARVV